MMSKQTVVVRGQEVSESQLKWYPLVNQVDSYIKSQLRRRFRSESDVELPVYKCFFETINVYDYFEQKQTQKKRS